MLKTALMFTEECAVADPPMVEAQVFGSVRKLPRNKDRVISGKPPLLDRPELEKLLHDLSAPEEHERYGIRIRRAAILQGHPPDSIPIFGNPHIGESGLILHGCRRLDCAVPRSELPIVSRTLPLVTMVAREVFNGKAGTQQRIQAGGGSVSSRAADAAVPGRKRSWDPFQSSARLDSAV